MARTYTTLDTVIRRHIYRVIRAHDGNITHAAETLQIDRRTLYRKLEKYRKIDRARLIADGLITIDYVSAYPVTITEMPCDARQKIKALNGF